MRERSVAPPIVAIPRIPANSISVIGEFSSSSERSLSWDFHNGDPGFLASARIAPVSALSHPH